jgi:hypothetical protein
VGTLDGDVHGKRLSRGLYIVRLTADGAIVGSGKIIIVE